MRIRNSKSVSIDEVQLSASRGAILHPALHLAFLKELTELEHKGKICRVPSTVLEYYNITISEKITAFEESCRQHAIVLSYY